MSETDLFNGSDSDPTTDSHERTNERTEKVAADVDRPTAVDAHAHIADFATIGDVLAAGLWPSDERHPRIRSGERAEIPHYVRVAVWYRDHGRCEHCTTRSIQGPWHLDHIVPWSAGGSDRSDNLRVLCEKHNLERSNFVDPTERPRRPVTWWCTNCMSEPWETLLWHMPDGTKQWIVTCPQHGISKRCAVIRAFEWINENGAEDWWSRNPIEPDAALVVAHCAHCGVPGMTDRPL